jgi:uncharacterized damage-inducible protein DinB
LEVMDVLELALGHNSWANLRLLEFCAAQDAALLEQPIVGTVGTVRQTLAHALSAEQRYLRRSGQPLENGFQEQDEPGLEAMRELAERLSVRWQEWSASSPDPASEIHGPQGSVRLGIVLAQAIHHGSDHRSQVMTALSQLGLEPPVLDLWAYGTEIGWVVPATTPPAPSRQE